MIAIDSIEIHKFLALNQTLAVAASGAKQSRIYLKIREIAMSLRSRPLSVDESVAPRNDGMGLSFCKKFPGQDTRSIFLVKLCESPGKAEGLPIGYYLN